MTENLTGPNKLLTEAQRESGAIVVIQEAYGSYSTARRIPYVERYRQFTGLHETPVEHIQRAAEDEISRD